MIFGSFLLDTNESNAFVLGCGETREALCALQACKDNFELPVIVSIAFAIESKGARTIMGNSSYECARKLTQTGADIIGTNCGDLAPDQMAKVVSYLNTSTKAPILVQPNAGKPKFFDGRTTFEMKPADFANGIGACIQSGATLVGGCCGTTPDHIRAVAGILNQQ